MLTPNLHKKTQRRDEVDTLDQQVNKILDLQRKKTTVHHIRVGKPKQIVKLKNAPELPELGQTTVSV